MREKKPTNGADCEIIDFAPFAPITPPLPITLTGATAERVRMVASSLNTDEAWVVEYLLDTVRPEIWQGLIEPAD